jgi:hypothetical protein
MVETMFEIQSHLAHVHVTVRMTSCLMTEFELVGLCVGIFTANLYLGQLGTFLVKVVVII